MDKEQDFIKSFEQFLMCIESLGLKKFLEFTKTLEPAEQPGDIHDARRLYFLWVQNDCPTSITTQI